MVQDSALPISHPVRKDAVLRWTSEEEQVATIVVVAARLLDIDGREYHYGLTDGTNTNYWTYHAEDVADLFVDTGLTRTEPKLVLQDDGRALLQEYCDHSFHIVHDSETLEPAGEQCINCRVRRALSSEKAMEGSA